MIQTSLFSPCFQLGYIVLFHFPSSLRSRMFRPRFILMKFREENFHIKHYQYTSIPLTSGSLLLAINITWSLHDNKLDSKSTKNCTLMLLILQAPGSHLKYCKGRGSSWEWVVRLLPCSPPPVTEITCPVLKAHSAPGFEMNADFSLQIFKVL